MFYDKIGNGVCFIETEVFEWIKQISNKDSLFFMNGDWYNEL